MEERSVYRILVGNHQQVTLLERCRHW